jgi:hypothetical protein
VKIDPLIYNSVTAIDVTEDEAAEPLIESENKFRYDYKVISEITRVNLLEKAKEY